MYKVITGTGIKQIIVEKSKNGRTVNPEIFTSEDQTFTGKKTFVGGIDTTELNARKIKVSEELIVDGKDLVSFSKAIPSDATEENKLTTESFVNSSVATNTAYFRGTYDSLEELEAYSGEKTNNDYAFVIDTDSSGNTAYKRYKYNGQNEVWEYEYTLNNSSFTSEQWAAINSGITEELVEQIGQGGGGSALVPSMTMAEYDEVEDKEDGQIREITDAPESEIPFVILDDTKNTSSNVLSAQKTKSMVDSVSKTDVNNIVNDTFTVAQNTSHNFTAEKNGIYYISGTSASDSIVNRVFYVYLNDTLLFTQGMSVQYLSNLPIISIPLSVGDKITIERKTAESSFNFKCVFIPYK